MFTPTGPPVLRPVDCPKVCKAFNGTVVSWLWSSPQQTDALRVIGRPYLARGPLRLASPLLDQLLEEGVKFLGQLFHVNIANHVVRRAAHLSPAVKSPKFLKERLRSRGLPEQKGSQRPEDSEIPGLDETLGLNLRELSLGSVDFIAQGLPALLACRKGPLELGLGGLELGYICPEFPGGSFDLGAVYHRLGLLDQLPDPCIALLSHTPARRQFYCQSFSRLIEPERLEPPVTSDELANLVDGHSL